MKSLKHFVILSAIVFMTCSPALSQIDSQQYLNCGEKTINQSAIEAGIASGVDPVTLAAELAKACPEMAAESAVAVATAAPNVNISDLLVAVIAAAPDQADEVNNAILAAFPAAAGNLAGNAFQATNNSTTTNPNSQTQTLNRTSPSLSQ